MTKNKLNWYAAISLPIIIAACGGDSGNNASNDDERAATTATFTYKTYEGLAAERPCGQSLNMVNAYVSSTSEEYLCCYDAALEKWSWQANLAGSCPATEKNNPKISSSSAVKSSSSNYSLSSSSVLNINDDYFIDDRDGQAYRMVTIGSQTWMAQNLNYDAENSYCYDNKEKNCAQYGRLYYGTNHCPTGWHLPTLDEWNVLIDLVGGVSVAGKMLKSTTGWNEFGNGTDVYEFSALPAGSAYTRQSFSAIGDVAVFMVDTVRNDSMSVHYITISGEKDGVSFSGLNKKHMDLSSGASIRCLKGNSAEDVDKTTSSSSFVARRSSSSSYSSTLIDSRDGQSYKVVKIGEQIWMAQNLNFETDDSYCYDDDENNCAKYGRLYTWTTAMDGEGWFSGDAVGCGDGKKCTPSYPVQGVCPIGWHLPNIDEWNALLKTVGKDRAITVLKSKSGWDGNETTTDMYGFSALSAGGKVDYGVYLGVGKNAHFWSSSELYSNTAYALNLHSVAVVVEENKEFGYSVRCVKD